MNTAESTPDAEGHIPEATRKKIFIDAKEIEQIRNSVMELMNAEVEADFELILKKIRRGSCYKPPEACTEFTQLVFDAIRYYRRYHWRPTQQTKSVEFFSLHVQQLIDGLQDEISRPVCIEALIILGVNDYNHMLGKKVLQMLIPHIKAIMEDLTLSKHIPAIINSAKRDDQLEIAKICYHYATPYITGTEVKNTPHTRCLTTLCYNQYPEIANVAQAAFVHLIPPGINHKDLFGTWFSCRMPVSFDNSIIANINAMLVLESKQKGICEALYTQFGIRCFSRYDSQLLLKQYREKDDTSKEYGVVVFPLTDHNGGFETDKNIIKKLNADLNEINKSIRITEAGSPAEMRERFFALHRKYYYKNKPGHAHKFSFVIIGGHGTPESIDLGKKCITKKSITDSSGKGFTNICEEGAEVILFSCSTAKEDGIAQHSAQRTVPTTGPDADTEIDAIYAHKASTPAGVYLDVKYTKANAIRTAA